MSMSGLNPNIVILMASYNGARFLREQLDSIAKQTYRHWTVIISDDGSQDETLSIIWAYQLAWGAEKLLLRQGPRQGYSMNFLSMACDPDIRADLYAFSDQDDVWMPDKLQRAVDYFLPHISSRLPRAYGSRTLIVDVQLRHQGFSPAFRLPSSFRNALVQNIAGGNTQVFNHSAKQLLQTAGMQHVVSHDWWLYQLVNAAGGFFHFDQTPSVLYRQHDQSIIGSNGGLMARMTRLRLVMNGRFKEWNTQNYRALCNVQQLLTKDNREILEIFGHFRGARLKDRIRLLEVCGLYRQTWQGTLSLWLATLINRI
jgi:glycosyltransferase involved in cell wall biosynthesis